MQVWFAAEDHAAEDRAAAVHPLEGPLVEFLLYPYLLPLHPTLRQPYPKPNLNHFTIRNSRAWYSPASNRPVQKVGIISWYASPVAVAATRHCKTHPYLDYMT